MSNNKFKDLPLRERKKQIIKQNILTSAKQLFQQRGYDNVTVAEIANTANISVKTLFIYFPSKEDLVFYNHHELIDYILNALINKPKHIGYAEAICAALEPMLQEDKQVKQGILNFQKKYGTSKSLELRILKIWEEYEIKIATFLTKQANLTNITLEIRFKAMQLIGILRSFTWLELEQQMLNAAGNNLSPIQIIKQWKKTLVNLIDEL